jgi:hypothetical protein|tara:strand:- start:20469 stop:21275 length:807 start_codon:yes stop_codon:yes gene_type:complete
MTREGHIFDMDDTLLVSPYVTDFTKFDSNGIVMSNPRLREKTIEYNIHKFFRKAVLMISDLLFLEVFLKKQKDYIVVCDRETGKPCSSGLVDSVQKLIEIIDLMNPSKVKEDFCFDKFEIKEMGGWFSVNGSFVVLNEPRGFYSYQDTIGMEANEPVLDIYHSVKSKAILTGRNISLHGDIVRKLLYMGMDLPNYALYCFDGRYNKNIKQFKAEVVNMLIDQNNWNVVHMYEDKLNWLEFIEAEVKEKNPEVEFIGHYIRNVKDRRVI